MFGFEVDPGLPHFGIYKEIKHGKTSEFFPVLNVEFCLKRIVSIHKVFRKVLKGYPGLQVHGFPEYVA